LKILEGAVENFFWRLENFENPPLLTRSNTQIALPAVGSAIFCVLPARSAVRCGRGGALFAAAPVAA